MSLLGKIGGGIVKALDTVSGIVTNPYTAITKGTKASTQKFISSTPLQNVAKTVVNVGGAALAVTGIGVAAGAGIKATAVAVGKTIIANPGKSLAAGAGVSLLAQSSRSREALEEAPSSFVDFTGNIGKFIDDPSFSTAANIAKENPVITGLAVTGAALVAGKVVIPALATASLLNNDQPSSPQVVTLPGSDIPQPINSMPYSPQLSPDVGSPLDSESDLLPSAGETKKRKTRRKTTKKPFQNITQKVYVIDDRDAKDLKKKVYYR